ncbi:MAG: nucleotide exchange factor GrpE [Desulfovibrio sp.]|jgi:molecular chaperone GrpE|nr:nucleotide exchange factor GrpE [Desulfovibrio sp.]
MLGFLSAKNFASVLSELAVSLETRLDGLDERLQNIERRERRSQAALENMLDQHASMLAYLQKMYSSSPPTEAAISFAEAFASWHRASPDSPEMEILSRRLNILLEQFGLELIADVGVPFNPDRHEACHVRFEPDIPINSVLEIVRAGFLSHGRVLRYASVIVNRPNS